MNLTQTLFLLLFLPALFSATGQTAADTIEVRKAFGTVFRYKVQHCFHA